MAERRENHVIKRQIAILKDGVVESFRDLDSEDRERGHRAPVRYTGRELHS